MNFVDKVSVTVISGKGGDGRRSFRRERYISHGGPDGGDGGNGGDIIFIASPNQNTLSSFRYAKLLKAEDGSPGGGSRKHGKSAEALVVNVPIGTEISDEDGELIGDLVLDNQQVIAASGGKGGFGNAHFTSSTRQAPNFAEKGEPGQKKELNLELKIIADVGLVGLPNAGKSTLLSRVSNARPEIADYPFTTLIPNLGVVDIDMQRSFLMADIPGLISGASEGKGLGHEFLKHIERTKLIVHLIDIYSEDVSVSYQDVRRELEAYSPKLANLKEVVVLNKIDGFNPEDLETKQKQIKRILKPGTKIFSISAKAGTNLEELKFSLNEELNKIKPAVKRKIKPEVPRITLDNNEETIKVEKTADGYLITGDKIEHFAKRTDFNNPEAEARFRSIIQKRGAMHELKRQGIKAGDRVFVGEDKASSFIY